LPFSGLCYFFNFVFVYEHQRVALCDSIQMACGFRLHVLCTLSAPLAEFVDGIGISSLKHPSLIAFSLLSDRFIIAWSDTGLVTKSAESAPVGSDNAHSNEA
jgi:hypothetical protein